MEKDNRRMLLCAILAEAGVMLLVAGMIFLAGMLRDSNLSLCMELVLLEVICNALIGFGMRKLLLEKRKTSLCILNWGIVFGTWLFFGACSFFPYAGWPVCIIFVLYALFIKGLLGFMIPALQLGLLVVMVQGQMELFFLYFLAGSVAYYLFEKTVDETWIIRDMFLSVLALVCCFFACQPVLGAGQFAPEDFLMLAVNLLISILLSMVWIRMYLNRNVYRYRDFYLTANEPSGPVLSGLKLRDEALYYQCIHTGYFCDRIATNLGLNNDVLKCAAYYRKLQDSEEFPAEVKAIWKEWKNQKTTTLSKETVVLICSETVISTLLGLIRKGNRKDNYDAEIEKIFQILDRNKTFYNSRITVGEMHTIEKIFKEEKLYYEFLR